MQEQPIRLGPDPNRLNPHHHHADVWVVPDPPPAPKQRNSNAAGSGKHSEPRDLLDTIYGLLILVGGLAIGVVATALAYKLTKPDALSTAWVVGYAATFLANTVVAGVIVYAVRRILLVLLLAAVTFGAGYAAWLSLR